MTAQIIDLAAKRAEQAIAQATAAQQDEIIVNTADGAEYTRGQLDEAFDMVQPGDDWRAPIDAVISECFEGIVVSAIVFFTATNPVVTPCSPLSAGKVRITSVGYRAGPAGP